MSRERKSEHEKQNGAHAAGAANLAYFTVMLIEADIAGP